ncbi:hypothetical protein BV25DRAFT_1801498 [Artomyces pyxidatus]|uniref:Uncharacterized protein n=1 Tax=Artomyces pyxidatus TaxID=48021 RepID=A0ACB8T5S9_9AGAM|nr:hypothetical protein BV25DRAFT_1801498 [Artomyces pyxidatus]
MRALHGIYYASAFLFLRGRALSPAVKVSMRTSWPSPPFLLELIETIFIEEPEAFFPLLDVLTDPQTLPSREPLTPEAQQQLALEAAVSAGFLSKPGAVETVQMHLGLHSATPKLEAFYQSFRYNSNSKAASRDQESCGSWVEWYGEVVCDVERLAQLAGSDTLDTAETHSPLFPRPRILPFDHVYPPPARLAETETPPRTAILYGLISSSNFRDLHLYLMKLSNSQTPRVQYIFRPIPEANRGTEKTHLSGYGVTLDLKKMDYLALDDRLAHKGGSEADNSSPSETIDIPVESDYVLPLLEQYSLNTTLDIGEPLTSDELSQIGAQTIQLVGGSETPFATFKQLVQDFPKYASSIARRVVVNSSVATEVQANSFKVQLGVSSVWLNGAPVPDVHMNPFGLLKLVRKERDAMLSLTSLGLGSTQALDLITHPSLSAGAAGDVVDGVFDASDRLEGGGLITWWNDIEKDSRYSRWPTSLYSLLRPTYPGQVNVIRLNMFNVVLVMDLSQLDTIQFIANTVSMVINRAFPVRFGIVPLVETEDSVKMANLMVYLVENYGRSLAMQFFGKIMQQSDSQPGEVDMSIVEAQFESLVSFAEPKEDGYKADFESVVAGVADGSEQWIEKARAYAQRLGTSSTSAPNGHAFLNGQYYVLDDTFLNSLQMAVGKSAQYFQEHVYDGSITEETIGDISMYFYDLPTTLARRNRHIVPPSNGDGARVVNIGEVLQKADFRTSSSSFLYPESVKVPMTLYVIADLDSEDGLSMVQAALTFGSPSSRSRVAFIHNPSSAPDIVETSTRMSSLISHLMFKRLVSKISSHNLLRALGLHMTVDQSEQTVLGADISLNDIMGGVDVKDVDLVDYAKYVRTSGQVVQELGLEPGEIALILNGRVIGPIESGEFPAEDLQLLENYEYSKRIEPVVTALGSVAPEILDSDRASFADLISTASSVISKIQLPDSEGGMFSQPAAARTQTYNLLDGEYTSFEIGNRSTALHHFAVILDPLSEHAQRYTSLFEWLSHIPTVHVKIQLQPAPYEQLPLKQFYRYNLLPQLRFDESGRELPAQTTFRDLPVEPIYTLGLDEPSSWIVRPREALYDLDNLQLGVLSPEESQRGLDVIYELDYLVVGGHARELHTNSPPRGVQLQLVTDNSEPVGDTLVVANLGYFQFKATPGVYGLEIREGRGREIFSLESAGNEGWESPTVDEVGNQVTLTSFDGLTLYPRLARVPGMETADVLEVVEEEKAAGGFVDDVVSRLSSLFKTHEVVDTSVSTTKHADINIFTVASGLLYEACCCSILRFASIMILSVLRNTNHTVKFWFIENFLSPSFLEFIPHFAAEYGFQYELVTYKWPSWLRQQREKQRIIWAYKILFLDVLFPMDLDKVIFVDADQIVRTDLKELIDVDLHGAPYGYTPMGDDNEDMEGFRFWKTGYWEQALHGRPYHISALYVVDLVRFRQMAAGDILRSQYQQLSADPNSLSNLDQDLPNNLQSYIPIYSLHEDWLWCETWCSKDRLDRAKTIDLCQNPLTKEPKLSRARQIPEWEVYDSEIARFTRTLADDGRIHASAAAADVNELANAGAARVNVAEGGEGETVELVASVVSETHASSSPVRDEL